MNSSPRVTFGSGTTIMKSRNGNESNCNSRRSCRKEINKLNRRRRRRVTTGREEAKLGNEINCKNVSDDRENKFLRKHQTTRTDDDHFSAVFTRRRRRILPHSKQIGRESEMESAATNLNGASKILHSTLLT